MDNNKTLSTPVLVLLILISLVQILALASFRLGQGVGYVWYHYARHIVVPVAVAVGELVWWLTRLAIRAIVRRIRARKVQSQLLLAAAGSEVAMLPAAKPSPARVLVTPAFVVGDRVLVTPAPTETATAAADLVTATVTPATAEDLKAQYRTFRAAKEALGIKARSWAELAAKVAQ